MRKKVYVGLSGGVDSAVSAALLQKEGYEVVGLFARIVIEGYPCTAGEDRREALRVAAHLRIPFEEIDLSDAYRARVFEMMLMGYRKGETPNPDTLCNREIKFGLMYEYARSRGAEYFATGHYARIRRTKKGIELWSGTDAEKDQSYFLWMVPEEQLSHTLFPVGDMQKKEVRALATRFSLPNAARKDSQGLCFLGPISMEEALIQELQPKEGEVLNEQGKVIGTHQGAVLYTIGERHGFSLFSNNESTPHYVVGKNIPANTITVALAPALSSSVGTTNALLREENWIGDVQDGSYTARFRYHATLIPARLTKQKGGSRVELTGSHVLPVGQSMVLYEGERCLGGGVIDSTI